MELDSAFTGTTLREYATTVTWRDTTNYAAAINDYNERYFNDEKKEALIAHPMNCVAITWPICERIWEYIEADHFPREIIMTQVHYTEYLEFHRPVLPGDKLTIRGHIAAILPHRAGTHVVIRFDAMDIKGQPVFTEWMGAMMRGVACLNGGKGMDRIPAIPENSGENPGWETKIPIDPLLPYLYDGCTNIVFPIHTSPEFARQVGLPGIILQGTATLALAVRELINREAGENPQRLKKLYCRFSGMVTPGTNITVQQTGRRGKENGADIFFHVMNGDGLKAISHGYAEITQ